MKRLLILLLFVAPLAFGAAPYDRECHLQMDTYADELFIDSSTAITGTWTCTGTACVEDTTSGNADPELTVGDRVDIGGGSYEVATRADDDNFTIKDLRDNNCNSQIPAVLLSTQTSKTVYITNAGVQSTLDTVRDGTFRFHRTKIPVYRRIPEGGKRRCRPEAG